VLRGNSGSGKTTIAKLLKDEIFYNVMVIGWDTLRIDIFNRFDYVNRDKHIFNILRQLCAYGKKHNFTVILEGIYPKKQYQKILRDIALGFPRSYFYYFDIPFQETIRRHMTRHQRDQFGISELKKWFIPDDSLDDLNENLIGHSLTKREVVDMIVNDLRQED
jgi:adenylate kinase family enzyme